MRVDISTPLYLCLIPLVLFLLFYIANKNGKKSDLLISRRLLCLRSSVCILLILAMTGLSVSTWKKTTTTLFLIDSSASTIDDNETIDRFLRQAEESKKTADAVGVITFAQSSALEGKIAKDTAIQGERSNYVNPEATDIANALQLALASFPENARKRLVIVSDGFETQGDAAAVAKQIAAAGGVTVDAYLLSNNNAPEVQLTKLNLAKNIRVNTDYQISMQIDSNVDERVNVKLFKNDEIIADQWVDVVKGKNNLLFHERTKQGGNVVYRGEISSPNDSIIKNNKAYAYTYISDVPQLLFIAAQGKGAGLLAILQGASFNVFNVQPQNAPVSLTELSRYDAVIVCDVSLDQLPKDFPVVLEAYLKTNAGGLFVTGGENSFAPGGYKGSKLEDILPVDMDLKTEGEEPSLAMVMVIDRSGSMSQSSFGVSNMEMAKEAAIRSLSQFKQGDSVGVIAFDDTGVWAVPIQQASENQDAIASAIGKIQPGGGTSILPALTEAFTKLSETEAKQKHILLLTDGQAEQSGYENVIGKMNHAGITLSTIAVGQDADSVLLKRLAEKGAGRYYQTDVFSDLPEIFAKETILAGKEYINNRRFYPVLQDMPELLGTVSQIPALNGFIATTAKPRADVVLKTDDDQPVLAFWQYGLGRSGVWTSDVDGRFSFDWLSAQEGARILLNAVSYVTKKPPQADLVVSASPQAGQSLIRMETPFVSGFPRLSAEIADAQGNMVFAEKPRAIAPGVYEFLADAKEGAYLLNIVAENEQGESENYQTGFIVPYPKEYDSLSANGKALMEQLAAATGGRMLQNGSEVFEKEAQAVSSPKNLNGILLWLAFMLFLLDVAFRRMPVMRIWAHTAWQKCLGLFSRNVKKQVQKTSSKKQPVTQKHEAAAKSKEQESPQNSEGDSKQSTAELLAKSRRKRGR